MIGLFSGCHPPQRPSGARTQPVKAADANAEARGLFRDVAATAGLNFRWGHSDREHLNILDTIGHGCAFLDYDGDGRLDILLVGDTGCRLYHNRGNGTFEDVTARALPAPPPVPGSHLLGCAVADYDNDGRPDIFVTGYGRTILYHNEGNGTFRDVTAGSGLEARGPYDWTTSAAWADVDGDGKLDLYVCRYVEFTPASEQFCSYQALDGSILKMTCGPSVYKSQRGSLYRNEGDGHFKDITAQAGLNDTHGNGLGCLFCDFNNDGKPDLFIANDRQLSDLYLNLGNGRFKNIGVSSGTAYNADGQAMAGMGVSAGDYDNDGRFDLLVATFQNEAKSLFHNDGGMSFSQQTFLSGLGEATLSSVAFGASFIDTGNRGLLDIVFTNGHVMSQIERVDSSTAYLQATQLFRNQGGGKFVEAGAEAGPDFTRKIVGRGLAVGDYDGDGKLDLLLVDDEGAPLLLHNESKEAAHWLTVDCLRSPGGSEAVGARVTVTAGGKRQVAEVRAGGSYLSTDAAAVHFGLGSAKQADRLEIRWPDGRGRQFQAVAADRAYRVSPLDNRLH